MADFQKTIYERSIVWLVSAIAKANGCARLDLSRKRFGALLVAAYRTDKNLHHCNLKPTSTAQGILILSLLA
jgi:hypothetical protein